MTKATLLLLALAGLTLAAPAADAQIAGSALTVALAAPSGPLTHDGPYSTVGTIAYTVDRAAAVTNPSGITVQYSVARAPAWLTVTVSPATDVITVPLGPSATVTVERTFVVTMDLAPDMTEEAIETVEIAATAIPSAPFTAPRSAKAAMPVHSAAAEPCERHGKADGHAAAEPSPTAASASDAPTLDAAAPAADAPTPVTIQQASAPVAPASYLAVAGFGVAGAGVGFLLRRRSP